MSEIYLCYDLKGIQSFIFQIPKLKYIIGGSALIDQYDRETVPNIHLPDAQLIFSGGGKGTFKVTEQSLSKLKELLKQKAHQIGVDIRFGEGPEFNQAAQNANELYPFIPELNSGKPCQVSGLYPVEGQTEHPVIKKRIFNRGDRMDRHFEKRLLSDINLEGIANKEIYFFRDVDPANGEDGEIGHSALGKRNRWAIIAMDGNDIGQQFRHQVKNNNQDLKLWISDMSKALNDCSHKATIAGINKVVEEWKQSSEGQNMLNRTHNIQLPVRPLVVGGDDIIMLCHSSYAMTFVKEACRVFEQTSKNHGDLWQATKGKITISAGVLFCSVSLPLHTAIPYAETLLSSAKTQGRKLITQNQPPPACMDWEHITDTMIDTPAAKRHRELFYTDQALDNRLIKLTEKPYTLEDYKELEHLANKYNREVPSTTRHYLLPWLTKSYAQRLGFYAEIKKGYQSSIFKDLQEFDPNKPGDLWTLSSDKKQQTTKIYDALMLLEEDARMEGAE